MPNPFYTRVFSAAPFSVARSAALNQEFVSLQTAFDNINLALNTFPDGTVAAPGAAFALDLDTGLRRVGTNFLSVVTAGVDRLQVNEIGNVGIGVAPATRLSVSGSAPRFRIIDTDGGSASYDVRIQAGALIVDQVGVAERMRVDPTGPVLINRSTSSGLGPLQVSGNVDVSATGADAYVNLRTASGFASGVRLAANGATLGSGDFLVSQLSDGSAYLFNRAAAGVFIGTSGAERFVVESTGRVLPGGDGAQDFGATARSWATMFAVALSIKNGSAPATPVGGGAVFVEAGALKYRGSSGTITTLAPA